ncbi:MAG: HlyC/CorC family transporter [Victivallales bacterium]|nr:HlyC/CorC family transporter [Victivallales bacterium]
MPICLGIFCLLALSAFFSGAETALMSISRAQLRRLANGSSRDRAIHNLLQTPQKVLGTILLGNLFVNTLLTALVAELLSRLLVALPFDGPTWQRLQGVVTVLLSILVVTPLLILFGELTPKVNAYRDNLGPARRAAKPLLALQRLATPLLWILDSLTSLLFRLFHVKSPHSAWQRFTSDEITAALDAGNATGATSQREHELLERILRFGTIEATEIMVPRTKITAVSDDLTLQEACEFAKRCDYNYLPVYHTSIDEIWGVLSFADALLWSSRPGSERPLAQFRVPLENGASPENLPVSPIFFVPGSAKIERILTAMKRNHCRMNVVVSEYGGTEGLVTRSAILEEIVGRFAFSGRDFNHLQNLPSKDGFLADGRARLRSVEETLGIEFEDTEADTLSGFVTERLGKIPANGDAFNEAGYRFLVARTSGKLAAAITITPEEGER